MTIKLINKGWGKEFTDALIADGSELRIICYFAKVVAIGNLLSPQAANIQAITRFNLTDFARTASDIAALDERS